ncbi:MAG: signal peptidase I [Gemmatimonadales bacterium]|jgi:signal peptidase I|nr:MAG: signal peptidase I [Gemmatimonadales bacterium]
MVAMVVFLVVRSMVLEAFKIPTGSMEQTLLVGDFLLVNKAIYGPRIPGTQVHLPALAEPRRGEVIVFNPPHEPEKNYVKRLLGVPGDTVQMVDKRLLVNGRPVDEPYARYVDTRGDAIHPDMEWQEGHLVASPGRYAPSRDTWGPIIVPVGRYFMLGDNRDNSEDSRYWGFVERDQIRGRPWIIYYSVDPKADDGWSIFHGARWDRVGQRIR